jgi:alpha-1,2-mannosyltransferase
VYGVLGLELAVVIVFAATYNALDFRIYMWGGHAVTGDSRLYLALAYGHWFTYSPFAAMVFVPVATLPLAVARVGWDLVSVAALAYSCTRILQIAGYRPTRIMVAGFVAAAMALDPVWETLFLGQINLILLALVLTDIWLVSRGSSWPTVGAGVGIAAAIKLTPAIFIVFFLLARRTRVALVAAGTFVLCGLIGFLIALHASCCSRWPRSGSPRTRPGRASTGSTGWSRWPPTATCSPGSRSSATWRSLSCDARRLATARRTGRTGRQVRVGSM